MNIALPNLQRRGYLRGFSLALSLGAVVAVSLLLVLAGLPHPWTVGLAAGVVICLIGFAQEELVARIYRAWNRRLVRPLSNVITRLLLKTCYSLILAATRKAGQSPRFHIGTQGSSSWTHRSSVPPEAYAALFVGQQLTSQNQCWVSNYCSWALKTKNVWALSLLPFLALLRWATIEEEKAFTANIYTLF